MSEKKASQIEALSAAPKRQSQDPIYVNLVPPVLDSKTQQAEKPKGAVAQRLRKELTSDPIIKLVDDNQQAAGLLNLLVAPRAPDVEVSSKVSIKEVLGVNRKTGKRGNMVAIVFEATITSQVPPASSIVINPAMCCRTWRCPNVFPGRSNRLLLKRSQAGYPSSLIRCLLPQQAGRSHTVLLAIRMSEARGATRRREHLR